LSLSLAQCLTQSGLLINISCESKNVDLIEAEKRMVEAERPEGRKGCGKV
jgi:hypothetical protein